MSPVLLLPMAMAAQSATLIGFAELAADTFVPGPTSGQFIEPANGRIPPFTDQQPVQGFSALLKDKDGSYLVLSDNGFGQRGNSSDYILSMYRVRPDFRTASSQSGDGSGIIHISDIINLSDPEHHLPYQMVRETDRLLTGADLDPESFRRAPDGSIWIGEEFNPSLLHFNKKGELMAPPYRLEGLASVDNPTGEPATLPVSRGFEGMAQSPDGRWLYPMLEGPVSGSGPGLNIYTFDIGNRSFTNDNALEPNYRYRLDAGATAIGDFTMYSESAGLVIERDSGEGAKAAIKKVYKVDFQQVDDEGFLIKTLLVDLLNVADPDDLDRDGSDLFTFPFWTIEGLVVLDRSTLAIANDNNYPFGSARGKRGDGPENTEFILIRTDPLWDSK